MAKRKRYQEKVARVLYERTNLNKTVFTMQKSWKEAEKTLEALEKQMKEKLKKKEKKEQENEEKKEGKEEEKKD